MHILDLGQVCVCSHLSLDGDCTCTSPLLTSLPSFSLQTDTRMSNRHFQPLMFKTDFRMHSSNFLLSQPMATSDSQIPCQKNWEIFPPLFLLPPTSRHEESYWHWVGFRISTEPDPLPAPLFYCPVLCCCSLSPLSRDWSLWSYPCVPISSLVPNLFSMQ